MDSHPLFFLKGAKKHRYAHRPCYLVFSLPFFPIQLAFHSSDAFPFFFFLLYHPSSSPNTFYRLNIHNIKEEDITRMNKRQQGSSRGNKSKSHQSPSIADKSLFTKDLLD